MKDCENYRVILATKNKHNQIIINKYKITTILKVYENQLELDPWKGSIFFFFLISCYDIETKETKQNKQAG